MTAIQKKWVRVGLVQLAENREGCAAYIREEWPDAVSEKATELLRYTEEAQEIRKVIFDLGV
jgi:hypothetical protein